MLTVSLNQTKSKERIVNTIAAYKQLRHALNINNCKNTIIRYKRSRILYAEII